jgi:regulator of protease activity HflC (stomatin/prohibitin superfamily)
MTESGFVSTIQGPRSFAKPTGTHISLGTPLRAALFILPVGAVAAVLYFTTQFSSAAPIVAGGIFAVVVWLIVSGVRVAAEWERGVMLRVGNLRGVRGPGIVYVMPIIEYIRFVDMRVLTLNIPGQNVITKDNVPAGIDGVLFFHVTDAERAIVEVQDFRFAVAQYAQASLRDVVGGLSLDELLSERERIQEEIGGMIDRHVKEWGLEVDAIRLLDIQMPEDLKRIMSRQAAAEREKRATIAKAEGDMLAAANLAEAADTMHESPGAMQLRALQTLDGLGASTSNTVVLFPIKMHGAFESLTDSLKPRQASEAEEGEKELDCP